MYPLVSRQVVKLEGQDGSVNSFFPTIIIFYGVNKENGDVTHVTRCSRLGR